MRFRQLFGWLTGVFRSRADPILENLALRQQLLALHSQRPRPRLGSLDRLFWVTLRRLWFGWRKPLLVVTPKTVVRWHRTGFRWYWAWRSRTPRCAGRRAVSQEVRHLIFRMVAENPTWGAPRIHGELLMLGFDISERSVSRWMKRAPRNPDLAKRWLVFLRNHREAIAMDFFTIPVLRYSWAEGKPTRVLAVAVGGRCCGFSPSEGDNADFELFVRFFERDFQHLVQQVAVTIQLIEGNSKKLKL